MAEKLLKKTPRKVAPKKAAPEELVRDYGYPAKGKAHGDKYLLFKTAFKYLHENDNPLDCDRVIIRTKDFARSSKVSKQLKDYLASPDRRDPDLAKEIIPGFVAALAANHPGTNIINDDIYNFKEAA
jgi:hypothetical protein